MNGYIITTAYGSVYKTDIDGYVLEYSNGLKKDKDDENRKTWQITGTWRNIGFGHTRCCTLAQLAIRCDLQLTNGLPRYGLTDIDHGTMRLHGNKQCHGVSSIMVY